MNINIQSIEIIETLLVKMDINSIKRKGQVVFHENHFCTKNLTVITETIEDLTKLKLEDKLH